MKISRQLRPIDDRFDIPTDTGGMPTIDSTTSPDSTTIDLLGLAAQYASMQFRLLLDVSLDGDDRRRAVPQVLHAAIDLGVATVDAIDAFANLVTCVIDGDERQFARIAVLATHHLGGADVRAAAASVIDAFSQRIASATSLDVDDVDAVLMDAWTAGSLRAPGSTRREALRHVRRMCRRR